MLSLKTLARPFVRITLLVGLQVSGWSHGRLWCCVSTGSNNLHGEIRLSCLSLMPIWSKFCRFSRKSMTMTRANMYCQSQDANPVLSMWQLSQILSTSHVVTFSGKPDCVELALATLIAYLKGASASVLALPSLGAEPRSFGGAEKVTETRFYVVVLLEAVLKSLKHGYPSPRRRSVVRVMVLWTISRGFNSEIGRPWPTSQFLLCVCLCVLCAEFSCVSAGTNWRSRQYCWAARQLMLTEMTQLLVAGQRAMQPQNRDPKRPSLS